MFWNKNKEEKDVVNNTNQNADSNVNTNANTSNNTNANSNNNASESTDNKKTKKKKVGSFDGVRDLSKMLFKERDLKIEKREITKEDKKAALITAGIIIGVGLLLWFLPFTHQFFEDIIFLRI